MVGNFKHLALFLIYLVCFSCQNKERIRLGNELVSENLNVLLDDLYYFNTFGNTLTVKIDQYTGKYKSDKEVILKKFQNKFDLNDESFFDETIKIEKIPKQIGNFSLFLNTDHTFPKRNNVITVSFVNLIISKNNQYASVEVIKSLGSGAKFEIYFFKQVNNKWKFESKEVIGIG